MMALSGITLDCIPRESRHCAGIETNILLQLIINGFQQCSNFAMNIASILINNSNFKFFQKIFLHFNIVLKILWKRNICSSGANVPIFHNI